MPVHGNGLDLPFDQVIDVTEDMAEDRRLRRRALALRIAAFAMLAVALAAAIYPAVLQARSARRLASQAQGSAHTVAQWTYPKPEQALAAARDYNQDLARSGQTVLGEAPDPFTASQGGSQAHGADSLSEKDTRYQSLLDTGDGVMGSIVIPSISVELPIRHGTSERTLLEGAGHLYGTSLPVGGASTHSVITGHRGLTAALMFTRLDEMRVGDDFYIEVLGQTLGYRVDRITVIEPDDTSSLRIVPGEDRVTLMTCTPFGVNTHRLLVSGHRVPVPQVAPYPSDVTDARTVGLVTAAVVAGPGCAAVALWRRRHPSRPIDGAMHAA